MKNYLLLVGLTGALAACQKDSIEAEEVTMRVNYYKQSCQGEAISDCYLVQEGSQVGTSNWSLFYDQIEGFQYEDGYIYTLRVRKEKVTDPPADASSIKYRLIKVIAKEKV